MLWTAAEANNIILNLFDSFEERVPCLTVGLLQNFEWRAAFFGSSPNQTDSVSQKYPPVIITLASRPNRDMKFSVLSLPNH